MSASTKRHAAAANRDPDQVRPGCYSVDPSHTRVLFGVSHFGFSTLFGEFPGMAGDLGFDPPAPGLSAAFSVTAALSGIGDPIRQ